jgi:hypothetical protein
LPDHRPVTWCQNRSTFENSFLHVSGRLRTAKPNDKNILREKANPLIPQKLKILKLLMLVILPCLQSIAQDSVKIAEITIKGGKPVIHINGEPYTPMYALTHANEAGDRAWTSPRVNKKFPAKALDCSS